MKQIFRRIVRYAIQAPSDHNTQPWKFKLEEDAILLYPDYSRNYHKGSSDYHQLFISLGCALENLVIAANSFGFKEVVTFHFNDEDDHIKVKMEPYVHANQKNLFRAITHRQVTRYKYDGEPIPVEQLVDMVLACKERDVAVKIFSTGTEISKLLPFIEEAALLQYKNKAYRKDAANWTRFTATAARIKKDGLRGQLVGAPAVPTWMGKIYMTTLASVESEVCKTMELLEGSPVFMLFVAQRNDKETWVKLGRSYERIALLATTYDIKHAHVNMPCEEPEVRERLKHKLGLYSEDPLLLIRMGYAESAPKSYRRKVAEVLEE